MKPTLDWDTSKTVDNFYALFDDDIDEIDLEDESFVSEIVDTKYEAVTPHEVSSKQDHLSSAQQKVLESVLETTPTLFDGKLGHYTKKQCKLELKENAKPFYSKAYSVPQVHDEAFKRELQHLVDIGVLRPCGPTEWAA
eukprot:13643444-Ditylum_brightwellii.AAC.1